VNKAAPGAPWADTQCRLVAFPSVAWRAIGFAESRPGIRSSEFGGAAKTERRRLPGPRWLSRYGVMLADALVAGHGMLSG
jgi:hypothetical protein